MAYSLHGWLRTSYYHLDFVYAPIYNVFQNYCIPFRHDFDERLCDNVFRARYRPLCCFKCCLGRLILQLLRFLPSACLPRWIFVRGTGICTGPDWIPKCSEFVHFVLGLSRVNPKARSMRLSKVTTYVHVQQLVQNTECIETEMLEGFEEREMTSLPPSNL